MPQNKRKLKTMYYEKSYLLNMRFTLNKTILK